MVEQSVSGTLSGIEKAGSSMSMLCLSNGDKS